MVTQVTSSNAVLANAGAAGQVSLEPGAELPARVSAKLPNDVLRLAVNNTFLDVKSSVPLQPGTDVLIKVETGGAQPKVLLLPGAAPGAASAQGSGGQQVPQQPLVPNPPPVGQPSFPATTGGLVSQTVSLPVAPTASAVPVSAVPQGSSPLKSQGAPVPDALRPTTGEVPAQNVTVSRPQPGNGGLVQNARPGVVPGSVTLAGQPGASTSQQAPAPSVSGQGNTLVPGTVNQGVPASIGSQAAPAPSGTPAGAPVVSGTATPGPAQALGSGSLPPASRPQNVAGPQSVGQAPSGSGAPLQTAPVQQGQAVRSPAQTATAGGPEKGAQLTPALPTGSGLATRGAVQPLQPGGSPATSLPPGTTSLSAQITSPQPVVGSTSGAPANPIPSGTLASGAAIPPAAGTLGLGGQVAQTPTTQPQTAAQSPLPSATTAPTAPALHSQQAMPSIRGGINAPLPASGAAQAPAAVPISAGVPQIAGLGAGSLAAQTTVQTVPLSSTVGTLAGSAAAASYPAAAYTGAQGQGQPPVNAVLAQVIEPVRTALAGQQDGLAGLFATTGAVLSSPVTSQKLPDSVKQVMQQIFGMRVGAEGPTTAKSLQQSVQGSGLFREAGLAQQAASGPLQLGSGANAPTDLKSLLLGLRATLSGLGAAPVSKPPITQPAVPSIKTHPKGQKPTDAPKLQDLDLKTLLNKLLQDTDAALSRIRLGQLASRGLGGDEGNPSSTRPLDTVMELPLAVGQETAILQMQIGRDRDQNNENAEKEGAWRLRFGLDLTTTGPVEAAVSLRGDGTFVSLWADRDDTHGLFLAGREMLETAFNEAGLDLRELRILKGTPKEPAAPSGHVVDKQT